MADSLNPAAPHHLPIFITAPGSTDVLMVVTAIFLVLCIVAFGVLFLRLHSLPERMAHKSQKIQFEIVAVLGLIALFTHIHAFWVAALLLALIDFPDFGSFMGRIAGSVEKIAGVPPPLEDASEAGAREIAADKRGAEVVLAPGTRDAKSDRTSPPLRPESVPARTKEALLGRYNSSGLFVPPLLAGKTVRKGNHILLGVVRAQMGHHRMRYSYRLFDNDGFLQSSVDESRYALLSNHSNRPRNERPRRRNICRLYRAGGGGRADFQARQLKTRGCRRGSAAQSGGARRPSGSCSSRCN